MNYCVLFICRDGLADKLRKEFHALGTLNILRASTILEATSYRTMGSKVLLIILDGGLFLDEAKRPAANVIRQSYPYCPIMVLVDKLEGEQLTEEELDLYFTPVESIMRTSARLDDIALQGMALIRSQRIIKSDGSRMPLVFPNLLIDSYGREVFVREHRISLTRREFDLLYFLASNPNQALSYEQIYEHVWPNGDGMDIAAIIANHIAGLRRKLASIGGALLRNEYNYGYRFVPHYKKPD